MSLVIINASGVVVRAITSYAQLNGAFTLDSPLPFTPAISDPVYIVNRTAIQSVTDIANAVWDAARSAHTITGSFGEALGLIAKIETGRWKIENNAMIFYDEDETTPLFIFNLFDNNGNPTMADVFERKLAP